MQRLLALSDEDFSVDHSGEDWPLAGRTADTAGLADMLQKASELEISYLGPPESVAQGERVLVVGRATERIKATNKTFEDDWVFAITVRNGKRTNIREYVDTQSTGAGLRYERAPHALTYRQRYDTKQFVKSTNPFNSGIAFRTVIEEHAAVLCFLRFHSTPQRHMVRSRVTIASPAVQARLDALRRGTDMKIQLGSVWHFSIAVRDPKKSAQFWTKNFALEEMFRSDEAIALTNDAMIIAFFKGTPHPETIDHLSFNLDTMRALCEALETLKRNGVELEDPGDEIGPTSPGSPHMGLWFHDPDGYRWELSVQNAAQER